MAAVAAVGVGATQVMGADGEEISIIISEINAEDEYIVLKNDGDSNVDIGGYTLAFEYSNKQYNQRRKLPEGTTIPADETLTVATGAKEVSGAVVVERPYEGEVLNNEREDVIALLDTDGNVVATSEETPEETTTTEETTTEESGNDDSEDTTSDETTTDGSDDGDSNGGSSDDSSEETESTGSEESSSESDSEDDC
ncbi:hypothetical protein GCM10009000_074590 [Halobacterium noricense]|uniref:LTD domain-containing protein n=2 Tax=Haladaptatus pallidirubidus TaxID=1008152 RepID=A0AAV3ULW0_9EURY